MPRPPLPLRADAMNRTTSAEAPACSLADLSHTQLCELVGRLRGELAQALRQWSMYATDAGSDLDSDDHTEAQWYRTARSLLSETGE